MTTDPARALAAHVCRTSFAQLRPSTVEATKHDIGDTFGCLLGGSSAPGIAEYCDWPSDGAARRNATPCCCAPSCRPHRPQR